MLEETFSDGFLVMHRGKVAYEKYFQYRSVETDVISWVCEKVTGKSLATLLSELLWSMTCMEYDAQITIDPLGACLADGGLCATLRDYARFGQVYLNNGYFNGQQIIPESWTKACRTGDRAAFEPLYKDRFEQYPTPVIQTNGGSMMSPFRSIAPSAYSGR